MSGSGPGLRGDALLAIGELAERTGKRPSSIRYYEQIGLLPEPVRVHGQRRYDPETLRTLAVIDTAQRAGLTLEEIKTLLSASPGDESAADRLREVADRKLPEITALLERTCRALRMPGSRSVPALRRSAPGAPRERPAPSRALDRAGPTRGRRCPTRRIRIRARMIPAGKTTACSAPGR